MALCGILLSPEEGWTLTWLRQEGGQDSGPERDGPRFLSQGNSRDVGCGLARVPGPGEPGLTSVDAVPTSVLSALKLRLQGAPVVGREVHQGAGAQSLLLQAPQDLTCTEPAPLSRATISGEAEAGGSRGGLGSAWPHRAQAGVSGKCISGASRPSGSHSPTIQSSSSTLSPYSPCWLLPTKSRVVTSGVCTCRKDTKSRNGPRLFLGRHAGRPALSCVTQIRV